MFSRCHMARQQVTLTCPKYIQIRQMALLSSFYLVETSETHATFNSNASAVGETKISPSTRSVSSGGVTGSSFLHCHHSKHHQNCGFRVSTKGLAPCNFSQDITKHQKKNESIPQNHPKSQPRIFRSFRHVSHALPTCFRCTKSSLAPPCIENMSATPRLILEPPAAAAAM